MDNLSARHQLVCAIVHGYPDAAVALAEALGVLLPEYDQVVAAPDSHYMKDGGTVYTDSTVRLLRDGQPAFFLTVEMQREYKKGKYATMHAYHGSSVKSVNVTFALPADETAAGCSVVGDFNGWRPGIHQLRRRSNGTRSASVALPLGTRTRFRYLGNNGHWFNDPDLVELDGPDSVLAV